MKAIIVLLCYLAILYGYIANVYKLCQNDFEAPLKPEIIRGIGVFVGPVGVITGYMTLDGEK